MNRDMDRLFDAAGISDGDVSEGDGDVDATASGPNEVPVLVFSAFFVLILYLFEFLN